MKKIYFAALIALTAWSCSTEKNREGFYVPDEITWAEQGWSVEERDYWHHLNAGQEFAPLNWVRALQAPDTNLSLLDPAYLRGLGFLDKPITKNNPEGLPVGFSTKTGQEDGRVMLGLTCASCHTGQLNYKGKAFRIDGASAGFNIYQFFTDYGVALSRTLQDSTAWKDFAKKVLAQEPGDEAQLKKEVGEVMAIAAWEMEAYAKLGTASVDAGHGRMDPFNRIGNEVFGLGLREQSNYHAANAPVGVPYLWDVARLNWVHYNASFSKPIARNILQVLGNGGKTYFLNEQDKVKEGPEKWASNFNIERLFEMEKGFAALKAPEWPSAVLGEIDLEKAADGKVLFMQNCAKCHAPRPVAGSDPATAQWEVATIPLHIIGTDTSEAATFVNRRYNVTKLLGPDATAVDGATGLQLLTQEMEKYAYTQLGYTEIQIQEAVGDGKHEVVRAKAVYKARPLDGIWSTPPFLHNGSVPNIYELLSPPAERSATFWLGTYEYDPAKIGYVSQQTHKSFLFDTRLPGNANTGHAFTDEASIKGKIGRALTHEARMAIIEYLKALPSMPPDPFTASERNREGRRVRK
jgi:mono/diheme cytochrome c family protein